MSNRKAPQTPDSPAASKTPPFSLGNRASLDAKNTASDSVAIPVRQLEWQQVNAVTWRLVDRDARQLLIEASHGQWGGYHYPKALAYVFDVGMNQPDWRVRVRQRGGWRASGCVIDLQTAKQIAQQAVENPTEPKPSKFSIPLNLVGGERRRPGEPTLDWQTRSYIQRVEIGAVKVDVVNEQPPASGDDESINLCATDAEVKDQRAKDLADSTMDEALDAFGNYARADGDA
jgi:hypothetical protein